MDRIVYIWKMPPKTLWHLFSSFKRIELRNLAKIFEIPAGRNKTDTIQNLIKHRHKLAGVKIEMRFSCS